MPSQRGVLDGVLETPNDWKGHATLKAHTGIGGHGYEITV